MVRYRWNTVTENILCEQDANGDLLATYTHEPVLYGELVSQNRGGQRRYYHFDGQESTVSLTDSAEIVTDRYTYSAFGEEVGGTGSTDNPFRYKGGLGYYTSSNTNECYVRRRSYRPAITRWMQRDPARSDPNPYRYADNSPIDMGDASGLQGQPIVIGPQLPPQACCVRSFSAPANPTACKLFVDAELIHPSNKFLLEFYGCTIPIRAGFHFGKQFEMNADFFDFCTWGCSCYCCEYRQYIKGDIRYRTKKDDNWVEIKKSSHKNWVEDGAGVPGAPYGHRSTPAPTVCDRPSDSYRLTRARGCQYRGADIPGVDPASLLSALGVSEVSVWVFYSFRGEIIDVCNGDVVKESKTWTVDCARKFTEDDVKE